MKKSRFEWSKADTKKLVDFVNNHPGNYSTALKDAQAKLFPKATVAACNAKYYTAIKPKNPVTRKRTDKVISNKGYTVLLKELPDNTPFKVNDAIRIAQDNNICKSRAVSNYLSTLVSKGLLEQKIKNGSYVKVNKSLPIKGAKKTTVKSTRIAVMEAIIPTLTSSERLTLALRLIK